jgi:hypothetical protein
MERQNKKKKVSWALLAQWSVRVTGERMAPCCCWSLSGWTRPGLVWAVVCRAVPRGSVFEIQCTVYFWIF